MSPRHIDAVHAGDPLELVGHVWPLEAAGIPATARCRIDRTTTPTPERNPQ